MAAVVIEALKPIQTRLAGLGLYGGTLIDPEWFIEFVRYGRR